MSISRPHTNRQNRLVGKLLTKVPENVERLVSHIEPLVQERFDKETTYGPEWPDKPVCSLTRTL